MINFIELTRKTKFVHSDYTIDKSDDLLKLLPNLTPKFDGQWIVSLVDPKIKFVFELVENNILPKHIDCYVYMNQSKLDVVMLKHPKLIPKKQKPWDAFMLMISELNHVIDPKAAKYLYKSLSGDVDKLKVALDALDKDCTENTITVKYVKDNYYMVRKPVYASEVVTAFFLRDKARWNLFNKLLNDLGQSYAYYSIRKQVFKWLSDKNDYLQNKEVDNRYINVVDAIYIAYVYTLFANSDSASELCALMYEWDNRSTKSVERRLYANIQ